MDEGVTLIEDLVILAASIQSGTDVVPINLIEEIQRRKPNWPIVSVSQLIDELDALSLGTIRPLQADAGGREFLINSHGRSFARQAKDRRSLRVRVRKNFLPAFNAFAVVVGASAAVAAAYFSYLGLQGQ